MPAPITSKDNRHIKELRLLLASKKARDETGLFALEGARLCLDAAAGGVGIRTLLLTEEALRRHTALEEFVQRAGETVFLHPDLAARMGDTKTPQGVFAICEKLDNGETAVTIKATGAYLLLAGLQDPGNLGTILRTALALGVEGALLSGCPDLYAPKVLRSAMGASLRLPVALYRHPVEMVARLREGGVRVLAAALTQDAVPVLEAGLGRGCGILIGNEGGGLESELVDACDGSVIIPRRGGAESLNAAVAASLLLWEMTKAD